MPRRSIRAWARLGAVCALFSWGCGGSEHPDLKLGDDASTAPHVIGGEPIGAGRNDAASSWTGGGDDAASALDDGGSEGAADAGAKPPACDRLVAVNGDCHRYRASIAAARLHTCAIGTDGRAYCWGANDNGRLGDGSTVERQAPGRVNTLDDVTVIAARDDHSCAVVLTGEAYCWGANANGQLGDGTAAERMEPQHVLGGDDFAQISAGAAHTCAVRTDGTVSCWGANPEGRLGDGTLDERHAATGFVAGLDNAAQVSVGLAHGCAVRRKGGVVCWGSNVNGQLGDGTTADRPAPVVAIGIDDAVQVAAGATHSCAVHASGRVSCWGANDMGQLGDGGTAQRTSPHEVSSIGDAIGVSVGVNHTCVVRKGGRVLCWGVNDNGELGDGTVVPAPTRVQVLREDGSALAAKQVSAGADHTCSTGDDGVSCWGEGMNGRRGDGTATEVHQAVGIGAVP